MSTVTLVQSASAINSTSARLTATFTNTPTVGNLMLVWGKTTPLVSAITGWTTITLNTTHTDLYVAYRVVQSGDSTTYGFGTSSFKGCMVLAELTGQASSGAVNYGSVVGGSNSGNFSNTTTVSVSAAGGMALNTLGYNSSATPSPSDSLPTGATVATLANLTTTDDTQQLYISYSTSDPYSIPSQPYSDTISDTGSTNSWVGISLWIKAASGNANTSNPSDSLTITDSAIAQVSHYSYPSDTLSISDSAVAHSAHFRMTADSLSITDGASRIAGYHRGPADTLSIADAATRLAGHLRACGDTLSISDAAGRQISFVRIAADLLTLSDMATRGGQNYSLSPSDTLSFFDSVLAQYIKYVAPVFPLASHTFTVKRRGTVLQANGNRVPGLNTITTGLSIYIQDVETSLSDKSSGVDFAGLYRGATFTNSPLLIGDLIYDETENDWNGRPVCYTVTNVFAFVIYQDLQLQRSLPGS